MKMLNTRELLTLQVRLDTIITESLWAPGGDPDRHNMRAAANAYVCLKTLDLPVKGEEDVIECLRAENIMSEDFLEEQGWPESKDKEIDK